MTLRAFLLEAGLVASCLTSHGFSALLPGPAPSVEKRAAKIAPKMLLIDMFPPEAEVWYGIPDFNVLENNITVPGLSPLYPQVHCTGNGEVCQITIGEAEINAACSITALLYHHAFDLTKTYFMIGGIAGVNPEVATLASVAFSRYAVQVALQYEFSQFEIPTNFTTGYIPLNSHYPNEYPQVIYGTEVFEFNQELQKMAVKAARKAKLADNHASKAYRAKYAASPAYAAGAAPPSVVECDVATSDVYYSGTILSQTMGNFTRLVTNGTGVYCMTAQEDNATAEALLRAAIHKLVDFSRIIVMRTASDMDRPYPGEAATTNLWWAEQGGFEPAVKNIYNAGIEVINMVLGGWNSTFYAGVKPKNYIGDIFGELGGTPDFGPYAYGNNPIKVRRSMPARLARGRKRFVGMHSTHAQ